MLTLPDTNQFYIGVRSCTCDPLVDTYMGSMKSWKVDRTKLTKEIICEYDTRECANDAECFMITIQKKANQNPLCMNKHTGKTFCTTGLRFKMTEAQKVKISTAQKGRQFSEEHRKKLSEKKQGYTPWNKDKTGLPGHTPWNKGMPRTDEEIQKQKQTRITK
jgi:hypothetical protein